MILSIPLTVSSMIRCLPCLSRSSVGSISRNSMLGNFCLSLGRSFSGSESCLRRGLPKTRIFMVLFVEEGLNILLIIVVNGG